MRTLQPQLYTSISNRSPRFYSTVSQIFTQWETRPISPPMKTRTPPRLPTNRPRIRRMRLHVGLATSLDPTSARIPTDSYDNACETSQSHEIGAQVH